MNWKFFNTSNCEIACFNLNLKNIWLLILKKTLPNKKKLLRLNLFARDLKTKHSIHWFGGCIHKKIAHLEQVWIKEENYKRSKHDGCSKFFNESKWELIDNKNYHFQ